MGQDDRLKMFANGLLVPNRCLALHRMWSLVD